MATGSWMVTDAPSAVSRPHTSRLAELRTSSLPVVTSARSRYRAPSGFGHDITTLGGAAKASAPGSLLGAQ